VEALRQGLRELGYIEGKNITIEWRYANGQTERQLQFAEELARLPVDIIVTAGPADTRVAKKATNTIPIVMAQDTDPVANGFIASLARPGGNITGLATLSPEIGGKQLEILKEIIPKLSLVAALGTSTIPGSAQAFRETELAAGALGVKLHYVDVPVADNIERAFRTISKQRAEALLVLGSPVLNAQRKQVIRLAEKNRLPATYTRPEFIEHGGLMTYGASYNDLYRRAATYVDKILKGAKPADLPVEQPKKFEFIINLKAAKQIGLTIPPSVLARADKLIK
jgi:putative ABC transport system substrate-binding protein